MSYFEDKEKLRTALEVVESDRRTKTQYELRERNRQLERIVATLAVALIAGFIIFFVLPKPKADGLDRRKEGTTKAE